MALSASGAIYTWGRNNTGQLGHSDSYIDIYSMEDFPRVVDMESIKGAENEEALAEAGKLGAFTQIAAGNGRS
eukprot:CAMPEP_0181341618 /NCGR_PEP_ID=MMETSP1101-20121128/30519_1 /TAXON_ID=46948 /ORGANISM="Rhodomonas abbreviata, Strain Caron Lab Isolate" /LENGTH=72 /DNA_ID=CAMNT_0023452933 /DNA_START=22 /DNA_END=237 /DNA_ORIENTATION=-